MSLQKTGLLSFRGQTGFNAVFIKLMNRLYWSKICNPAGAKYYQLKLNSFSKLTCEVDNMEKIYEEKNILRETMKAKLAALTTEDKNRQSEIVMQKVSVVLICSSKQEASIGLPLSKAFIKQGF